MAIGDEPKSIKPEGKGILGKVFVSEGAADARARAGRVIEQARLNEAIRVIEVLEMEVTAIQMPSRFRRDKIVSDSVYSRQNYVPKLKGLTEDEFKRQSLLINLESIKNDISRAIGRLEEVVLDIEATKQEG